MKKAIIRIAVLVLFSAAAVAAVMLLNGYYTRPITVKTPLADGEIIERVELSRGELWFKDEETLISQLSPEDFAEGAHDAYIHPGEDEVVPYYILNGGKRYTFEELLKKMNINPEHWTLKGEPFRGKARALLPCFVNGERSKPAYAYMPEDWAFPYVILQDITTTAAHCYASGGNVYIAATPTPVKWRMGGNLLHSDHAIIGGVDPVKIRFGDIDSQIGDISASIIVRGESYFSAFLIVEQTAYDIQATNLTQAEFVELILSICNAPHPEKENYIDFLLK